MSGERVGRAIRALRHRQGWTQADLGRRAGCSGSVVSRLERGSAHACSIPTLERLVAAVGARLVMFVDWRGGELDRLLDADHALLRERWSERRARAARWIARQEVTYSVYGERGSIDELAFDAATGTLLVTELKTGIYDSQLTALKMDEKERLAVAAAERFGWTVKRVVPSLVLADTRTNRRRVHDNGALFGRLDCRGRAALAWLADPGATVGGLLVFVPLSDLRPTHGRQAGRQRVRPTRADARDAERERWPSDADRGA
jgi:transcriptional regulator with XRE-family HTH domain